jgi:hypothetical protein
MKQRKSRTTRFAVCIDNRGYPASLEQHKIYRVVPDDAAAADRDIRIIDESGEDYLYSADRFVEIEPPQPVKRSLLHAARAAYPPHRHRPLRGWSCGTLAGKNGTW